MIIVLCPKAFAGTGNEFERGYLKEYLAIVGVKAKVVDEVWSSWRYRITQNYGKETAEKLIRIYRGWCEPETLKLKDDYTEIEPQEYNEQIMVEKTRGFIQRKWAEVRFFITQEPKKYVKLKVNPISLRQFYLESMSNGRRDIVENYCRRLIFDRE